MNLSCILAGVGGQGAVLASKLIAAAAMERGEFVRTAETIGMAQRGGSVVSHVRVGEGVYSPQIPKGTADVLIGFEPGEAVRCLSYLKPCGAVITADKAVTPPTASLGESPYNAADVLAFLRKSGMRLTVLDTGAVCREAGTPRALNVALLGAAAESGALGFPLEELESVMKKIVAKKYWMPNQKALRAGARAVHTGGMNGCG